MYRVLVIGAGKIGELIASLLSESGDYEVHLADNQIDQFNVDRLGTEKDNVKLHSLEADKESALVDFLSSNKIEAVLSSLPYYCNPIVAQAARLANCHYFDLTEDTSVTDQVKNIAEGASSAFVPQCGLAPGYISIVAHDLMKHFEKVDDVLMRVGALPQQPNNALKYSLTWSTDGVINEYGNPCFGIMNGEYTVLQPLEGRETIEIDGMLYEAFNTSGGLGSLAESYRGTVNNMNYKTMRYPGHCKDMRLLMNDLKMNEDRGTLKRILENAIPKTFQDLVIVYVAVRGQQDGELIEEFYVKKVYPKTIAGILRSAIQITTASGLCAVVDQVMRNPAEFQGYVTQEMFTLDSVLNNHFGKFYQ